MEEIISNLFPSASVKRKTPCPLDHKESISHEYPLYDEDKDGLFERPLISANKSPFICILQNPKKEINISSLLTPKELEQGKL